MDINFSHRLLIISNSVLSKTRANGKTILSFFDHLPKDNVRQLYFLKETPTVAGYEYFQIKDEDVIKGIINPQERGRAYKNVINRESSDFVLRPANVKKPVYRLIREAIWKNRWRSQQLDAWLDEFKPDTIFFVAGDSLFAYDICEYIAKKYSARVSIYITDDYIMKRSKESFLAGVRRKMILRKMKSCVLHADVFFTISNPMRLAYKNIFGRDSQTIVNIPDPTAHLYRKEKLPYVKLIYAGSLYYGREYVVESVVKVLSRYNAIHEQKGFLYIYSNTPLTKEQEAMVSVDGVSQYGGALSKEAITKELESSDILVFVESFDDDQINKTIFSLSTKVPEYLSMRKAILAVGPDNIGSMDYLKDVAMCVNNINELYGKVEKLMDNETLRECYSSKAYNKFAQNHDKTRTQERIEQLVFGEGD